MALTRLKAVQETTEMSQAKMTFCKVQTLSEKDAGYTLVELLVVIALAGLVLTTVPTLSMGLLPSARDNKAVAELKLVLFEVRAQATSSGKAQRVDLAALGNDLAFEPHDLVVAEDADLKFFGDGGATGGTLVIRQGDKIRRLEVDWLTGRIYEREGKE
jgi:general secretion pathway protein H